MLAIVPITMPNTKNQPMPGLETPIPAEYAARAAANPDNK